MYAEMAFGNVLGMSLRSALRRDAFLAIQKYGPRVLLSTGARKVW